MGRVESVELLCCVIGHRQRSARLRRVLVLMLSHAHAVCCQAQMRVDSLQGGGWLVDEIFKAKGKQLLSVIGPPHMKMNRVEANMQTELPRARCVAGRVRVAVLKPKCAENSVIPLALQVIRQLCVHEGVKVLSRWVKVHDVAEDEAVVRPRTLHRLAQNDNQWDARRMRKLE